MTPLRSLGILRLKMSEEHKKFFIVVAVVVGILFLVTLMNNPPENSPYRNPARDECPSGYTERECEENDKLLREIHRESNR